MAGHLSPDAPPLASTHNPQLSRGFCQVLARMLEKDRDSRYLSAEALLGDLADLRAGRTPERASDPGSSNTVWIAAAGIGVVAVAITWLVARAGTSNGPTTATPKVAGTGARRTTARSTTWKVRSARLSHR